MIYIDNSELINGKKNYTTLHNNICTHVAPGDRGSCTSQKSFFVDAPHLSENSIARSPYPSPPTRQKNAKFKSANDKTLLCKLSNGLLVC